MNLSDKKGVQLIVQFLAKAGIKNVVLSPGSRNAPLSLSFHHHPNFNCRIIADERVAAYHALGISLFSKQPTVLVCTSGTASLNYAPAIAEAYYQHIPLIVITADRPAEWIDQGDGQTIRQENVYSNYILKSFSLVGDSQSDFKKLNSDLNEALTISILQKGPVHLNVSLEEPLYKLVEVNEDHSELNLLTLPVDFIEEKLKGELKAIYESSKNVLIIAGQMNVNSSLNHSLAELSKKENILVFTENTSNLNSPEFISCIDRFIDGFNEDDKINFSPDLLITIGGAVVSKKVKSWLRQFKPKQHWKIGREDLEMDTYRSKSYSIPVSAEFFIQEILNWNFYKSDYRSEGISLNEKRRMISNEFLSQAEFSDLKVFDILYKQIPQNSILHLGNSSPVRYAQLIDSRKDLIFYSNRGTSGIDGCTSTAAGMAEISNQLVTLISGDISFFYDSNAFWNDYLKNLKVIVINNGGGGIFRIIDQPENIKDTEKLFETRHHRKAEGISKAFGINYLSANDENSLEKAVKQLYADNLPTILEIFTPTEKNALILKQYFAYLKNN
jgi:2-succinyl-5-enolpyruvyl-6-hydroxy-3-cyclohexene-1-carboxylate synthase